MTWHQHAWFFLAAGVDIPCQKAVAIIQPAGVTLDQNTRQPQIILVIPTIGDTEA